MTKDYFADAARARVKITKAQQKAIRKMYQDIAEDIEYEIKSISQRSNVSSILRTQYLGELSKQVQQELNDLAVEQNHLIRQNMASVATSVVNANTILLNSINIHVTDAYSYIPSDVVKEIASGKLYEGRWNLSSAIWKNTRKTQRDINTIVAKGVAQQKSTYDIAKDLEKYVNPAKRKAWEWSKVYPGTSKVIDYNAQRLARTMVSHAYQDSFVRTTKDNPFIDSYRWLASGGDRMCELCAERDGKIFEKDELPLDHPNGMCTFVAVISSSYKEIGDRLADWVNGKDDVELDDFAESLGYQKDTFKSKVSVNA